MKNLSNGLFTSKDAAIGELRGVSLDLMRELASRLGVPVESVLFGTPCEVWDAFQPGAWDVAIPAIEPARAQKIAFSHPITEIEATCAVRADSALRSVVRVIASGVRIAAPGGRRTLPEANNASCHADSNEEFPGVDRLLQRTARLRPPMAPADSA